MKLLTLNHISFPLQVTDAHNGEVDPKLNVNDQRESDQKDQRNYVDKKNRKGKIIRNAWYKCKNIYLGLYHHMVLLLQTLMVVSIYKI